MSKSFFKASFTFPRAALLAGAAVAASLVLVACASPSASQPADGGQPTAATGQPAATTSAPAATAPRHGAGQHTVGPAVFSGDALLSPVSAPSSAPSSGGGAALAACRSASLAMTIDLSQANGAAGSAYYPLNFTNRSTKPCEMYGYPGVSFVTAGSGAGKQIGAAARRSAAFAKLAVRLVPGSSAHAWLKVTVAANYPARPVTRSPPTG